jgi:hypothetical protein
MWSGNNDQLEAGVDQLLQESVLPIPLELAPIVSGGVTVLTPVVTVDRVDVKGSAPEARGFCELSIELILK